MGEWQLRVIRYGPLRDEKPVHVRNAPKATAAAKMSAVAKGHFRTHALQKIRAYNQEPQLLPFRVDDDGRKVRLVLIMTSCEIVAGQQSTS
jgi:hypothetical protein